MFSGNLLPVLATWIEDEIRPVVRRRKAVDQLELLRPLPAVLVARRALADVPCRTGRLLKVEIEQRLGDHEVHLHVRHRLARASSVSEREWRKGSIPGLLVRLRRSVLFVQPSLGLVSIGVGEVVRVVVHGVDAYGYVRASRDEVAVNVERLLVVDGLLAPERAGHRRGDAQCFVHAGAEILAAIELGTDDDVFASLKSRADLLGQSAIGVWGTGEVEEECRQSRAGRVAA